MKQIETLVSDIYTLISEQQHEVADDRREAFGRALSEIITRRLFSGNASGGLRFSNLGSPCDRKTWYEIHDSAGGEPLPPEARLKFLFGDILEHLLLFLAEEAGHKVEAQQVELEVNGIVGHPDAIIDGVLVDVKSASTFAFNKFSNHELEGNDPFGYLTQINAYHSAMLDDERLVDKERVAFLAVDKQLGHLVLDIYPVQKLNLPPLIDYKKTIMSNPKPPPRAFRDEPDGKSGNMKIPTVCSYCAHKKTCWPGLRTFLYSQGPRFLTHVERLPEVKEVT